MATMNGSSRPAADVAEVFDSLLSDLPGRREAPRPNPEVLARAKRRQFTGEYKQKILTQTDAAKGSGEIGAVLRREGLYSSHLTKWRQERAAAESSAKYFWPTSIGTHAAFSETAGEALACQISKNWNGLKAQAKR